MTIQNAKTKSDTFRKELAAIRARALRRRTRAIALSVFLVAELAALGVSLRFSLTFAVCVGLSVFFTLFTLFFLQLLRKTPDLRRVARRLETRFLAVASARDAFSRNSAATRRNSCRSPFGASRRLFRRDFKFFAGNSLGRVSNSSFRSVDA